MKQTASVISTYSADLMGVCSSLYELGGMVIMHDPSGCNTTYTTHDEPRWYDMPSQIFISGLSEMEAIMGDDDKLINDIIYSARELKPKFIAIAGTPVPTMTGFDYDAVSMIIENETGIPTYGIPSTGMNTYIYGAALAFKTLAEKVVLDIANDEKIPNGLNILGLTPLDFQINGCDRSISEMLENAGFKVISKWAMGSSLEDIENAGKAAVNLVVSSSGIDAAKLLYERFGTPYVIGSPIAGKYGNQLLDELNEAIKAGDSFSAKIPSHTADGEAEIVIIGESVTALSMAASIELETGRKTQVMSTTEFYPDVLRDGDLFTRDEEDIREAFEKTNAKLVIADPMFERLFGNDVKFISAPHIAFSGRCYRDSFLNLAKENILINLVK